MTSTDYDVFNGDADGLCALVQLRQAEPRSANLITGVKRDISLLERVPADRCEQVTALDISFDKNRQAVVELLSGGADVFYVDHHFAGDLPNNDRLTTLINTAPDMCTSLLINGHLRGERAEWAVVGAFGDNLDRSAENLGRKCGLSDARLAVYRELGVLLNYNAYGATLSDLHITPIDLYERILPYASPELFLHECDDIYRALRSGYAEDMRLAAEASSIAENQVVQVIELPDQAWARRVSGVYGNALANAAPERAHAILTKRGVDNYVVSVRAPIANKTGADEVCRQFATGGGRAAAAGINALPAADLPAFIELLAAFYSKTPQS